MKLTEYREWRHWLDGYPGCYRIGYFYGGEFRPRYIGRAANVWKRIETYMDPAKCHNDMILQKLQSERNNLWFTVVRTPRYHGLEARQQAKHGILDGGLYEWNRRIEWACLEM